MNSEQEIRAQWEEGDALEAGRLIFENLYKRGRVEWAADILKAIVDRTGLTSPATEKLLRVAADSARWNQGHKAFGAARGEVVRLEAIPRRSLEQEILLLQTLIAELVAKVTYNETEPVDEFDEDSGWWIAPCLKDVLNAIGDDAFARAMWFRLYRTDLLEELPRQ